MSSISDSENYGLSGSADDVGSALSLSMSSVEAYSDDRTPDHLSGFTDESVEVVETPTGRGRGTSVRREVTSQTRIAVEEVTAGGEGAAERTASQASSSGREHSESPPPKGEQIDARERPSSRPMRINDQRVYRRGDWELAQLADGRPVYTVDYFTSAITPRYLAAMREEFSIPLSVELLAPGPDDLPSRPPAGYITLSAEYFRAGLRLPFHPFLRRALTSLNVAPAQLNANAYRILVGCYILWMRNFAAELPIEAFQNLYRMKSAPSSTGSYYFQGFKGTFITGCPDSDKQFKHLWFYAGGWWLHGELPYDRVPRAERVPVTFRNGYVWSRAPHIEDVTLDMIDALREQSDQEKSQHRLLSLKSLEENRWLGSSSSSARADDHPRAPTAGVTIARMPEPTVHYHSRTAGPSTSRPPSQPVFLPSDTSSTSSSSESTPIASFGPRVADEDLDALIKQFYPTRGLRIEEPMADRQHGRKRLSEDERRAKLLKMARTSSHGKGKAIVPPSQPTSQPGVQPSAAAAKSAAPQVPVPQHVEISTSRPSNRTEQRSSRSKDDRPASRPEVRSSRPREDSRPGEIASSSRPEISARDSPAHRALLNKISEKLSVQVAESCRRPDAVTALEDNADILLEALCVSLSGSAVAREAANRAAEDLRVAEAAVRDARAAERAAKDARNNARAAEKKALDDAKAAEARAQSAEEMALRAEEKFKAAEERAQAAEKEASEARQRGEEVARKMEADLASARAQAVEEYQLSEEFQARLAAEYKDGMRDMKLGFTDANPDLFGVNWGFLPEDSGETVAEEVPEEGEVTGVARPIEDVVVLDGDEQQTAPDQPATVDQPATPNLEITIADLFPDQRD